MTDYDIAQDQGFDLAPDAEIRLKLDPGTYGVNGEAELSSIVGRTYTYRENAKRAGQSLRWIDFAVAIDSPDGKVFVHSTPWKQNYNTMATSKSGSRAPDWFKALGLSPVFQQAPDENGNHPLVEPVEGIKVLVTIADNEYTDKAGDAQVNSYITMIERRP